MTRGGVRGADQRFEHGTKLYLGGLLIFPTKGVNAFDECTCLLETNS